MNIKFGICEILIIFSFLIYSNSWWFSIVAFSLGLTGAFFSYAIDWAASENEKARVEEEKEKTEAVIKNLGDAVTKMFGSDKKSGKSIH